MKRPVIGVVPLIDIEKESYWMLPGYMEGIRQAGGLPMMMPLTGDRNEIRQMAEMMDGFLFTGGHDVSPSVYGQEEKKWCGECCPERDEMEKVLFWDAMEMDKPILGICRGIQLLNALMGGTLYQDLDKEHPSDVIHHQKPPYDVPSHQVEIIEDTPLYELLKVRKLAVNSYHHQAVRKLGTGLCSMAVSEDGLIEAVYVPDKPFVWGVQWHPEFSYLSDQHSQAVLREFTAYCK
ncbi:gamma-glutamyl-gamma-aminobutyrate hydrolase family protein [Anaerostipes butyraticus]|uniref:gamma-glutamyl-gamma-aminobutyrate hydrolase family protein n=1 Tax=Anaerostipes butyraticus TaxID=645466 RepID=UPI0025922921|nr:gamma-glutamyl-gamma-aminobutyrate hydrolase family protein [uncultured Anaerostipes sp.]